MKRNEMIRCQELTDLCRNVKKLVGDREYDRCLELICQAMADYPDAPQPHNLMGLVLEQTGCHPSAMKHFRAALALDPTYAPVGQNLTTYGTFYSECGPVYDECEEAEIVAVSLRGRGAGLIAGRK